MSSHEQDGLWTTYRGLALVFGRRTGDYDARRRRGVAVDARRPDLTRATTISAAGPTGTSRTTALAAFAFLQDFKVFA